MVLDPRNGEVVAMASYPTFDPREYTGGLSEAYAVCTPGATKTHSPAINRPIDSAQPPGSVWKIVTGMAALQTGQITPRPRVDCPSTWGWGKRNWNRRNEGAMDLATALKRSCDTFFYELSYNQWLGENRPMDNGRTPDEVYQRVAREFGFDEPLGHRPARREGWHGARPQWKQAYWERPQGRLLRARPTARPAGTYYRTLYSELCSDGYVWRGGDAVNASIGQGDVQTTPLQVAAAYVTVANGGTLYRPHLGKEIRDANGELVEAVAPEVVNRIEAPAEDWAELQYGLEQVVMGERGTGVTPLHRVSAGPDPRGRQDRYGRGRRAGAVLLVRLLRSRQRPAVRRRRDRGGGRRRVADRGPDRPPYLRCHLRPARRALRGRRPGNILD